MLLLLQGETVLVRIFKTKSFCKIALDEQFLDTTLYKAAIELNKGLYDADLGGHVYKKRIAKPGRSKSSSARCILAFKAQKYIFYIYGFAKNDKENITSRELIALKKLAEAYLALSAEDIEKLMKTKELVEIIT